MCDKTLATSTECSGGIIVSFDFEHTGCQSTLFTFNFELDLPVSSPSFLHFLLLPFFVLEFRIEKLGLGMCKVYDVINWPNKNLKRFDIL